MTPLPPKYSERLTTKSIPDCTVLPYQRAGGRFYLGAFDSEGNCIPESLLYRHYAQIGYPGAFVKATAVRDHTAIYAGQLFRHYGHFLLEALSRLWFAKARPEIPIVWACRANDDPGYAPYQAEILDILGISNPPVFLTSPTLFDEIIIPEPGYMIQTVFHPEHARFLGAFKGSGRQEGFRLWLSRSALPDRHGANLMEVTIERRLAAAGWTVMHPEQLSVSEQLDLFTKAERIAGGEGSAFHSLVLLDDLEDLKVDIFRRRPYIQNKNYRTIADRKGFSQTLHLCASQNVIAGSRIHVINAPPNASEYLDKLEVPVADSDTTAEGGQTNTHMGPTARRVNALAKLNGARSYLEIGVANGRTFQNVLVSNKDAVDPRFRFDPRTFETKHCRFFEMPSDQFFALHAEATTKYDVIFLDGLHTFEQTLRDFCATQRHCHEDTIWVIDDVFPTDIFSAHRDRSYTRKYRRLHNGKGEAWHGDVYKVVFAIHDFFVNFDYKTIDTGGNRQTVLVRRPRPLFTPFCNDLEAISRMTYYDFYENRELLNLETEDAVLDWVCGLFRKRAAPAS